MRSDSLSLSAEQMLKIMGIESWQLRTKPDIDAQQLTAKTLASTAALVVVSEAVTQQPALQQLLQNILYATGLPSDEYYVVTQQKLNPASVSVALSRQILNFGCLLPEALLQPNAQVMQYPDIEQVYQQPLLKRTIMQGLKASGLSL